MAEIVNLRAARKAKARSYAARQAEIARAAHGRSKAEKAASAKEADRTAKLLDGARRDGNADA